MRLAAPALMALTWLAGQATAQTVTTPTAPRNAPQTTPPTEATPAVIEAPIISDDDFAKALPSLTSPATTPETPPAPVVAQPAPKPAEPVLTETAPSSEPLPETLELPPLAPSDDPTLNAALPPLDSFNPDAAPIIIAQSSTQAAPVIRYDLHVDGLAALDLENRFKDLSALHGGKGEAANAAMLRARLTEDEQTAVRLLKGEGYYDAVVVARIESPILQPGESLTEATGRTQGRAQVRVTARPGERYTLSSVTVKADPSEPPDLVADNLPLKVGDPVDATLIKSAEANVALILPQQGYPFAELGLRDVLIDPQTRTGDYTLPVTIGPRARFGAIRSEGRRQAFGDDHVQILARFESGDLYDSRDVDDLRQALSATGLFASVGVEPVLTGQKNADGTAVVDLKVTQNAGRPRTLAGDIGFSTGQGLRTELNWTHRNFRPPEGALIASVIAGTQEQGLSATFRRSNAKRRDRTFQYGASYNHQAYDSYEAQTVSLAVNVSRVSTPLWQKRWTWSYGAEVLATRETGFSKLRNANVQDDYFYASLPLKLNYDQSDDLLNPTRGWRAGIQSTPTVSLNGGGGNFVANVGSGTWYRQVSPRIVLAARAQVSSIYGAETSKIAPSRRIYAGGGGSVRGFGYQELGPRDPANNDPIGGRSSVELAFEARYRIGNIGIVPFVDAGQVYDKEFPGFSDIRFGVGIGARYYTNFGPVRIDVATPVSRRDGESPVSLYVGIGQAF
ncbi:BamA/TamA family outer membrane protein [Asticcacaulis sp. AND118]|uniref:BamA/TamA family outer membrane protein n=1 Tax=Asticcacaulis sp. AND118 TaxID=2840468 RepID=UPI001CFFD942|nr:BamA/TamA family outer membrane protein [Asticcacaulis sp. AND118]UDF02847.1 BamA/TamA family outer membrane protein [Asticcacaulis sp. AND118]